MIHKTSKLMLLAAYILVSGCMSVNSLIKGDKQAIDLEVQVNASASINPDLKGRASPVEIRLFQLSSITEFDQSDFFDLYRSAPLSSSLLDTRIFIIKPGQNVHMEVELNKETQYIAVIAAYRDIDNAIWRDHVQVRDEQGFLRSLIGLKNHMSLRVEAQEKQVRLVDEEAE